MKEVIVILVIIIVYIFLSYKAHIFFLERSKFGFLLYAFLYLILTYIYFEFINQIEIFFRNREIYFEFGHANIMMLEVMALCFLLAFINIGVAIFRRYKKGRR